MQKEQVLEILFAKERHQADREAAGVADPRKNDIRLTVKRPGSLTP
jgi:hypothetical protein